MMSTLPRGSPVRVLFGPCKGQAGVVASVTESALTVNIDDGHLVSITAEALYGAHRDGRTPVQRLEVGSVPETRSSCNRRRCQAFTVVDLSGDVVCTSCGRAREAPNFVLGFSGRTAITEGPVDVDVDDDNDAAPAVDYEDNEDNDNDDDVAGGDGGTGPTVADEAMDVDPEPVLDNGDVVSTDLRVVVTSYVCRLFYILMPDLPDFGPEIVEDVCTVVRSLTAAGIDGLVHNLVRAVVAARVAIWLNAHVPQTIDPVLYASYGFASADDQTHPLSSYKFVARVVRRYGFVVGRSHRLSAMTLVHNFVEFFCALPPDHLGRQEPLAMRPVTLPPPQRPTLPFIEAPPSTDQLIRGRAPKPRLHVGRSEHNDRLLVETTKAMLVDHEDRLAVAMLRTVLHRLGVFAHYFPAVPYDDPVYALPDDVAAALAPDAVQAMVEWLGSGVTVPPYARPLVEAIETVAEKNILAQ